MFEQLIENSNVCKGVHASELIDKTNPITELSTQQNLLELAMRASNFSKATRSFDLNKKWTYLMFEEFFDQGDFEQA